MTRAGQEDADPKALADLIRKDASLTGHILRLSNSAMFRPLSPVVSLTQALTRLGMVNLRQIALLIATQTRVFSVRGHEALVKQLFRHSLAAALFAQEAAKVRKGNAEEAFLCGLLHDVGKPVALQALVDIQQRGSKLTSEELLLAMDLHHADIGSQLIKSWKLPARVSEAVRYHHRPTASVMSEKGAMLTALASDLAHLLAGDTDVTEDSLKAHPMVAGLGITPAELHAVLAQRPMVEATLGGLV
jgi:putative nucleotidyltransferase with HDIG domain